MQNRQSSPVRKTLILGGTGKTGRRIVSRLETMDVSVRVGSRSGTPPFDWNNETTWDACLAGIGTVYVNYAPDLAVPGATDSIRAFVDKATREGVGKMVLLSGRGEAEAQACERIVQDSGVAWTIVRASWFFQNFSEGAFLEMVQAGRITLPAGSVKEPFIDVEDIADVATAALTESGHAGEVYEVTGPRLLTFAETAAEMSKATGREIAYTEIPHEAFIAGANESGAPKEVTWLLDYLFSTVLDGRNAHLTDGVQRALGRAPRDFTAFARRMASSGTWRAVA